MVQHKKYIVWAGVFGLLVALHPEFLIATAHAQAGVDTSLGAVGKTFAQVMSFVVMGLHSLALVALGLVEFFLRPEFLNNEGMMGPEGSLKRIWLFSRDIVNFLFALMLIGVAFYTIIAGNSTKIKEYIKHFVLAVILVNFSWFFPRVILDISNVLTSTVFSLPSMVLSGASATCMTTDENGNDTPCVVLTDVRILPKDPISICATNTPTCKCFPPIICYKFEDFNSTTTGNSHAILGALAINFGKIATIITVPQSDLGGGVGNGVQVQFVYILNVLFALIFVIAMAFPLLALAVGLLMRVLILWVCIAFMPFTFIGYVLSKGDLGGGIPGLEQANIWKHFVTAAFLPLLVAIPITVGFIMIMAGMAGMGGVMPPIYIQSDVPLISGVSDFFQFLWAFFAIAIIWIGTFAALRKSEIIGKVTDKIQNYGQSIGSAALKAPLMVPLPVPGGSIAGMAQGPGKMASAINAGFKDGKTLTQALNDAKYGGRAPDSDVKIVADKLGNLNKTQMDNIAASLRQGRIGDVKAAVKAAVGKDANIDNLDDQRIVDLLERTKKFDTTDIDAAKAKIATPADTTPPPGPSSTTPPAAGTPPPGTPAPGTTPVPPPAAAPPTMANAATDIKVITNTANESVIEITNPQTKKQSEINTKDIKTKADVVNIYNSLNIPAGMENDPNVRRAAADAYRKVSTELDTRAGKTAAEIELSGKTKLIADALANPANDTDDAKSIIQNSFGNDIT